MTGEKKNLKWRIVCQGVEALIAAKGLRTEDVMLWSDWQSIYQDDKAEKLKGVMSLIKYATLCQYMLIPTEEAQLTGNAATYPEEIPGYGKRGWQARSQIEPRSSDLECRSVRCLSVDVEP